MRRTLKWSALGLGALLVALAGFIAWLLFTTGGARWVAGVVTQRWVPQVSYATLDGTLAGRLVLTHFRLDGPPDAARVQAARIDVEPSLRTLLSRRLQLKNARVEGLTVWLPPARADEPEKPLWVPAPLTIGVEDFALREATIRRGDAVIARVRDLALTGTWTATEAVIEKLELRSPDIEGALAASGRVVPEGNTVRAKLVAQWRDVLVPERLAGRAIATAGQVTLEGTPKNYAVAGELDAGPPGEPTHAVVSIAGTDRDAILKQLHLVQSAGQLDVTGTVEFAPVAWKLEAQAREFDPGALLAGWPGRVNLEFSTQGTLSEAGPSGTLRIAQLSGTLRGRPIAGAGDIEFAAPSRVAGNLRVSSGRSRIAVQGRASERQSVDAQVTLAVAQLDDWIPRTTGSLTGSFQVRGAWPRLTIEGVAEGKGLGTGDNRVAKLRVDATVASPLDPQGKVHALATGATLAGREFARITLDAEGNQARHRVTVTADSEQLEGSIELAGGRTRAGWRGELAQLRFKAQDIAELKLRAPSAVVFEKGVFSLSQTCLEEAPTVLCSAVRLETAGPIDAGYSFERVPLKLANSIAPDALAGELQGEVQGHGRVRRGADGQWTGDLSVSSASARLAVDSREEAMTALADQGSLLIYEDLDLQADFSGMKAAAKLTARLLHGGSIAANVGVSDLNAPAPRIAGKLDASLPTVAPFGAFVPSVANLDGEVTAHIEIGGSISAPEFTGTLDATKLTADLGALGIELRDGRVEGEAKRGGGFRLAGSAASGKGHIEFNGTMSERGVVDLRVLGQDFQAADIPAANVVMTPNLTLTGDSKGYQLKGEVVIPRASVNLQKLPKEQPPGVSPDVVVVRNGKEVTPESQAAGLPITAVVTVKLGENIAIQGYGLESTVTGQLVVREAPGAPTTGSGQLLVSGTYKAYGQDLTIREGRLLFAGSPLDNPRLAIVAMRDINSNLKTGLRIAGSAQRPVITVISDPNLGEADALSYLVTGRSLSDVGSASSGSQGALASATQSLEGAGAGLVAKRIGQRLGLDEAGVEENEMIGGSALTIGEYLSPRLYLSYGIGLFEPGEVIGLRYKLSEDVGVKVQRGSEETRAGVEYRIER